MFEITSFETRRRLRGTAVLTAVLVAMVGLIVGLFPSVAESGVDFEAYVEALPPEFQNAFLGSVSDLGTIEGFLVTELYQFVWVLVLGIYFGYTAATAIAGEVESNSIDLLLVNPVSRSRIVVGKFLAVLPVILFVNAVGLLAVFVGVDLIGEYVDLANLVTLHALFVVYHSASAAVGIVSSVLFPQVRRAQGAALGVLFGTYLVDSLTLDTDFEWLGAVSFSRYFDVGEIFIEGDVDWGGIGILVAATLLLLILAAERFERMDVDG